MRKGRTFALFSIAVVMGVSAAWLANNWILKRMFPTAEASATTPVVVAALRIPFGQKIEDVHIKTIAMPNGSVPEDAFHEETAVEGKIATQALVPGEVILKERVADHIGGSTLAAVISPKKRAVTIRVNDVIGVAGFLLPGNRIDVLASRKEGKRVTTQTLLKDIKVLAVDQTSSPDNDKPVIVRAVTVELSPGQSETLVKAKEEGSIQLTLRNPLDKEVVVEKKVEKPKVTKTVAKRTWHSHHVTIIRGTKVDNTKVKY